MVLRLILLRPDNMPTVLSGCPENCNHNSTQSECGEGIPPGLITISMQRVYPHASFHEKIRRAWYSKSRAWFWTRAAINFKSSRWCRYTLAHAIYASRTHTELVLPRKGTETWLVWKQLLIVTVPRTYYTLYIKLRHRSRLLLPELLGTRLPITLHRAKNYMGTHVQLSSFYLRPPYMSHVCWIKLGGVWRWG